MKDQRPQIHFKDLLEYATDLIHVATTDGTILYANPAWQTTLGMTTTEIIGQSIYSFVAESVREKFRQFRNEVLLTKALGAGFDTVFAGANGKEIFVEGYISCTYENGNVLYTHSILRDVTKRNKEVKHLQEMYQLVQEREENFYQLIHHAPDAIIVIDDESKIILWNPMSETIFGWKAHEVTGTLLGDSIIPEKYRDRHYQGMKRFLSTGEAHVLNKTIDITAMTKSGREFDIALTISKAVNKGQTFFIAFIRDISEQKKMERDLRLQKQELEQRNEELAQYATMASHDLKEPIRKILIFSDLLQKQLNGEPDAEPNPLLVKVQSTAARMQALVDGISKFSSISADINELASVDLREVIDEVLADLDMVIQDKQAIFFISPLPQVRVSRIHVHQLFENLVNNSLKYSKPGEPPVLEINGQIKGAFGQLTVADNGQGFNNNYAEKVFLPFQRLHGTSYPGTGIGLSICKKIVEAYKGTIRVDSTPGKGSTFTFTLPVG